MAELVKKAEIIDIGTRHQMMCEAGALLRRRVLLEKNSSISDDVYRSEMLLLTAQELLWAKRWEVN